MGGPWFACGILAIAAVILNYLREERRLWGTDKKPAWKAGK